MQRDGQRDTVQVFLTLANLGRGYGNIAVAPIEIRNATGVDTVFGVSEVNNEITLRMPKADTTVGAVRIAFEGRLQKRHFNGG
ncbi:hypothetical protein AOA61_18205 [Pseudomonas sp. 2995-1]|nr:hypothetical protein AOA61_18205 [Pseudomonas sp. 2995-1]